MCYFDFNMIIFLFQTSVYTFVIVKKKISRVFHSLDKNSFGENIVLDKLSVCKLNWWHIGLHCYLFFVNWLIFCGMCVDKSNVTYACKRFTKSLMTEKEKITQPEQKQKSIIYATNMVLKWLAFKNFRLLRHDLNEKWTLDQCDIFCFLIQLSCNEINVNGKYKISSLIWSSMSFMQFISIMSYHSGYKIVMWNYCRNLCIV